MTDPASLPPGYRLHHAAELDSTNEEARRAAEAGEPGGLWIMADRQTSGRGRRGRAWVSPAGNLFCTLLLRPNCTPAKAAELSFVAGLALHDAVATLIVTERQAALRLKWPNDLLYAGKKLAGILLESATEQRDVVSWLAVGLGLNLARHPEGAEFPATSLAAATGMPAAHPSQALAALAWAMDARLRLWQIADLQAADGFARIRADWLARAAGVGDPLVVRLTGEILHGIFEGLEDDGALRLGLDAGGYRRIAAGDIFFPASPG